MVLGDQSIQSYFFNIYTEKTKSFGRTVGTAARVKSGQKLITLRTSDEFASQAKEALRKSSHKLPTPCNIVVNQK